MNSSSAVCERGELLFLYNYACVRTRCEVVRRPHHPCRPTSGELLDHVWLQMGDSAEPIQRATALLSTLMHCRLQAKALQKCKRGEFAAACEQEEAAFITCSQANIGLVVQHLVQIADKFCPSEVEALQRCRLVRPGDTCELEDMEAMRCASIRVLAAAHAKTG